MASDHFYTPPVSILSDYALSLDNVSQERYKEKLLIQEGQSTFQISDPYVLRDDAWENDIKKWPQIEFGDIYTYLLNSPGGYNGENLKNYKSLSAYEYVESGKVQTIFLHKPELPKGIVILKALVQPSQRLNEELLRPWVVVRENGTVLLAHCTCVAGIGESCSHIAALLFKVEIAVRLGYTVSAPTEQTCSWNNKYNKKIESMPLKDASFKKSQHIESSKKRRKTDVIPLEEPTDVSPLTAEELAELREIVPEAVFCKGFANSDTDSASECEEELPPTIKEVFEKPGVKPEDIASLFTKENCCMLEKATVGQADNSKWMLHRKGRLCSSSFGRVIKRKTWTDKFIFSVLNERPIRSASIKWGQRNEDRAIRFYIYKVSKEHQAFKCEKSGLFVDPEIPFLGSSPDGKISCSCCGEGLVEVKCPFTHRNKDPTSIFAVDKNFYLDKDGNLKENHEYYYQVQGQMAISKKPYCDFVVWTPAGLSVSRVRFDEDFWKVSFLRLKNFYFSCIFPKLNQLSV